MAQEQAPSAEPAMAMLRAKGVIWSPFCTQPIHQPTPGPGACIPLRDLGYLLLVCAEAGLFVAVVQPPNRLAQSLWEHQ
jgi:hypothetical protein